MQQQPVVRIDPDTDPQIDRQQQEQYQSAAIVYQKDQYVCQDHQEAQLQRNLEIALHPASRSKALCTHSTLVLLSERFPLLKDDIQQENIFGNILP
jgi:hypothetical protein